jgi:DNA modification methylase
MAQKIEQLKTTDLIPYVGNTRTHDEKQVAQVAASIKEFGFTNPILVDGENGIIAGHGRLLAAQKLGMESVPCLRIDHLTDAQRRAYVIADNKLALNAGWDEDALAVEIERLLEDGFDLDLTGFGEDEIADFLKDETEGLTDEDDVPELADDVVSVEGDVWLLGDHRLMCGDSTSIDAVEKLMDGKKADMVFTDPPYGDNHAGMTWKHKGKGWESGVGSVKTETIKNDSNIGYLEQICTNAMMVAKDKAPKMVFFKWSHYVEVENLFQRFGKPSSCCVWDRDEIAAAVFSFNPSHEFCFFWGSLAVKHNKSNLRNVWRCKKDRKSKKMHPTVKPVEIVSDAIDVACVRNGIVVDFFGGSGSTLIACETIKRQSRIMELDAKYIDVIIKRWQEFTGKQATNETTGKTFADTEAKMKGESIDG